uniref:Putative basic tail protein n=1 Tax=Ixodes ricinus TaxID=34613 RepID=A0A0K8R8P8_IXORI
MKLGIVSSIFIIVEIASANSELENPFPDVIAVWPSGNVTIKHGCPMTTRTEALARKYPHCIYYCRKNSTWFYGFYYHATTCKYGDNKLPGVCILGMCHLETDTVTDATFPESTQASPVENVTTSLPPVESGTSPTHTVERESTQLSDNENNPTQPVENEATAAVPVKKLKTLPNNLVRRETELLRPPTSGK